MSPEVTILEVLLTDEKINERATDHSGEMAEARGAWGFARSDFDQGAQFARSLYEQDRAERKKRVAELEAENERLRQIEGFYELSGECIMLIREAVKAHTGVESPFADDAVVRGILKLKARIAELEAAHSTDSSAAQEGRSHPASPASVGRSADMETTTVGTWQLEELLKAVDLAEVSLRTGFSPPAFLGTDAASRLRDTAAKIRLQSSQPVKAKRVRLPKTVNNLEHIRDTYPRTFYKLAEEALDELKREGIEG